MADHPQRTLDLNSVKALSHPLRVLIYDKLSVLGPMTASMLAGELDESSGATSYHLRQLAKHGLVREVEGRGSARERWWELVPGALVLNYDDEKDTPGMRQVVEEVTRQWGEIHAQNVRDYIRHAPERLPREWTDNAVFSTATVLLPAEVLAELAKRYAELLEEVTEPYRGTRRPGTRPVQIQFNAFALIGGEEVTE